jgi:hypothetical protein
MRPAIATPLLDGIVCAIRSAEIEIDCPEKIEAQCALDGTAVGNGRKKNGGYEYGSRTALSEPPTIWGRKTLALHPG